MKKKKNEIKSKSFPKSSDYLKKNIKGSSKFNLIYKKEILLQQIYKSLFFLVLL